MLTSGAVRRRLRSLIGPMIGLGLAAYFGHHAVYGGRGLVAVAELDERILAARMDLQVETERRTALERRVSLLRPTSIDPDLLEERARLLLNVGRAQDVIILDSADESRKRPSRVTSP